MMQKYVFKPYDPKFPILYRREKSKLKRLLPKNARIEHIGSTAVPNLHGKSVVDIVISLNKKDVQKAKIILEKNNYEFRSEGGNKERLFFKKHYKYGNRIRWVHIHLTFHDSTDWRKAIAVREYLKKHSKEAKKYEKIKKRAVKICKDEGKIYRNCKNDFLRNLTKKALKEFY